MTTRTIPPHPVVPPRPANVPVAPPAAAPVAPPAAAPVAPPAAAAPVAPPAAAAPVAPPAAAAEAPKKKRGRQKGQKVKSNLVSYFGLFQVGADGNYVVDAEGNPVTVKLTAAPTVGKADNEFNPDKNTQLRRGDFSKAGDFFRHKSNVALYQSAHFLEMAKLADEGKATGARTSKLAALRSKVSTLMEQIKASMGAEGWKAFCEQQGVNPADYE